MVYTAQNPKNTYANPEDWEEKHMFSHHHLAISHLFSAK